MQVLDKQIADSCTKDFEIEDSELSDDEYDSEGDEIDDFQEPSPEPFINGYNLEDSDKEIADSCSEDFELEDPEPSDDEYDSEDDNTDDFLEMEPGVFEYNYALAITGSGRCPYTYRLGSNIRNSWPFQMTKWIGKQDYK